jgi:signal transduction histidine kinase
MKNPLTPVRLAVRHLAETAIPEQRESLEVLTAESGRLEQLAREFATLGRLPEGPSADVDLGELLGELLRTSVPETVTTSLSVESGTPPIVGHYDPLRRFANISTMGGAGARGAVADHGPGITRRVSFRVGLSIVKQAIDHHRGSIAVRNGAGARAVPDKGVEA